VPWLIGGSADLAPSTNTLLEGEAGLSAENPAGRNLHYGVREHGMGSVMNGLALHGGVRPYGATFLIFSDYMRPAIRLAALMEQPTIYVFTHDSVGLGEDGPTHQPVEQLAALRAIPGLVDLRPGDANETAEAWRFIMGYQEGPVFLSLTRQALPNLDRSALAPARGLARGAYILADAEGGAPEAIILATGSEVGLAVEARELLQAEGIRTRVVSMPSWTLFARQAKEYREGVLPREVRARVAVEAAGSLGWDRWVGLDGAIVGLSRFGASAPATRVFEELGFTAENVAAKVREVLGLAPVGAGGDQNGRGPTQLGVDET
jgi:transketolase